MFKDYYECREWLEGFIPLVYGKEELGLARIEYLLKLLGNPERKFKSIHVAGTSGKGSTAYYIARLLQYSRKSEIRNPKSETISNFQNKDDRKISNFDIRYSSLKPMKVGLHVSPHLVDIRERMQIFYSYRHPGGSVATDRISKLDSIALLQNDYSLMPIGRFLRLFEQVRPVVEKIQKEKPELTPSYFEILVAASFKYFAEEKIDWAVVEVGLGGRLDATNVLQSRIAVITNIGLDHTEILGDTIEKIAFEKAGIIKTKVSKVPNVSKVSKVSKVGIPVVTGATGAALRVIEKVAKEKNASLVLVSGSKYLVSGREKKQKNVQNLNLELAEKVVEVALGLDSGLIRKHPATWRGTTLPNLIFPGRFEEIDEGVILDGAHNPDKMKALIHFVNSKFQSTNYKNGNILRANARSSHTVRTIKNVTLVLAFKKRKNWQKMVDLLVKNLPVKQIIATQFYATTDMGKYAAVDPKEIAKYVSGSRYLVPSIRTIKNSQEATFEAIQATSNQQPATILVAGSLYLVGEVRTLWYLPEF